MPNFQDLKPRPLIPSTRGGDDDSTDEISAPMGHGEHEKFRDERASRELGHSRSPTTGVNLAGRFPNGYPQPIPSLPTHYGSLGPDARRLETHDPYPHRPAAPGATCAPPLQPYSIPAPSDLRPDLGGIYPLARPEGPFQGQSRGGGGESYQARRRDGPVNPDGRPNMFHPQGGGMMIGPESFPHQMVGGAGGGHHTGGLHGDARFDPIAPGIQDPDVGRGMGGPSMGPGGVNLRPFGAPRPAPQMPGEPDNDALQPMRFGQLPSNGPGLPFNPNGQVRRYSQ